MTLVPAKLRTLIVVGILVLLFLWAGWIGGSTNLLDRQMVLVFADIRHQMPRLTSAVVLFTQLGGASIVLPLAAIVSAWLWFRSGRGEALQLAATVIGGRLLADGIKLLYDRPRPAFDLHPVLTNSSSYPSGHTANSMVAYVAMAMFASPPRIRRAAVAAAIVLAAAIGLTRPFLGVHWPSDVVGGWILAAIVLLTSNYFRSGSAKEQHQVVGWHPPLLD